MHKSKKKSFVMIGTGNLAFHLTGELIKFGFILKQVVGRTKKSTQHFAAKFNTKYCINIKDADPTNDLYFFCVPDDQIALVASKLKIENGIVIHCSGTTSINVLMEKFERCGVLYPLYTFSKNDTNIDFKEIPIFIEGDSSSTKNEIKKIAFCLSKNVTEINSVKRKKLHLAAVLSANFSNYLNDLADEYLKKEGAGKIKDLLPLLKKTISKLEEHPPKNVQTGPAKRNDQRTIKEHLSLLKNYPVHKALYHILSSGIVKRHRKK